MVSKASFPSNKIYLWYTCIYITYILGCVIRLIMGKYFLTLVSDFTMVRKYKRKSTRGQYGNQQLTLALEAVKGGMPLLRASKEFDIPRRTIRRHRDRLVANPGVSRLGRHRVILTENLEKELNDHIQYMEKSLYGLTTRDVRRLAYELAEAVGLQHPFSHDRKMAGKDWLSGFLTRHQNLSIREPQGTNLSRAVGFNKPKVQQFFGVYKELLQSEEFTPARVWNMDETGITSVHKPGKILATKGVKQVSRMTSGERGKTVTVICGMNAAGMYVPPMLIFPRKRMVDALMAGAPPQAVGYASPNGWTDAELFLRWLEHFVNFTNASKDVKQIIILDGHHSHKTLAAVTYAREHGLHLLTLPPHSTHKMQPLDRTYFKSLKSGYNAACDSWMVANPGKRISFFEMAAIFGKAYLKSATPEKAVGGFACCGIWPFDENIFPDSEFAAAAVTDEPEPQRETANGQDTPITELTGTVRSTEKQPSAAIGEEETSGSSSEEATQLPPPSVPGPSTQDVPGN